MYTAQYVKNVVETDKKDLKMKNLIRFISLAVSLGAILTCNLSLPAMKYQSTIDTIAQTHILTKLYAGTDVSLAGHRIEFGNNRIFVLLERKLAQQESIQQILVDTPAYELMESKLQTNLYDCEHMLSDLDLKACAKKLVSKFSDKTGLKEFTTKMLPCVSIKHFSYGPIFLLALIFVSNKGSFIVDDSTDTPLFDELSKLNQKICGWVSELIKIKKYSLKQAEQPDERISLLSSVESEIDDSFVAASAFIIAKHLLTEIKTLI